MQLNRPVCWREDRIENLTAATAAREDSAEVEAAVTEDGRILALRARLLSDFGAYSFFPANYMLRVVAMMLPNVYRIADFEYEMAVVLSTEIRGPNACADGDLHVGHREHRRRDRSRARHGPHRGTGT